MIEEYRNVIFKANDVLLYMYTDILLACHSDRTSCILQSERTNMYTVLNIYIRIIKASYDYMLIRITNILQNFANFGIILQNFDTICKILQNQMPTPKILQKFCIYYRKIL